MIQSPSNSRKRPAPGALPIVQQQPVPQPAYYPSMPDDTEVADNQYLDFSNQYSNDNPFAGFPAVDNNAYAANVNGAEPPTYRGNFAAPTQSTDLIRRARGQQQQLAARTAGKQQEQWNGGFQQGNGEAMDDEDEQELDRRVTMAKKDAQSKRKAIPPFVQKLSSFLDTNNTDLIRWSDDGRSFIVLDEDEFARTLIPELFKHNNYASFVRQLNMYGFHKTVNIKDGSLRAAERARKGVKPPSMYTHPYFRRNRPDLLWLIQRPSSKGANVKRKHNGEKAESDDERQFSPDPGGRQPDAIGMPNHGGSQDLVTLPRNELVVVRQELQKLQQQQRFISKMITQLKEQNEQFYRQATAFQALHDRHENSINAILTFLATFYNRSLEGHAGQNLVNMFSAPQKNQQHGSVVDVGDYREGSVDSQTQMQRFQKRQPLLLPAPLTTNQNLQPGSVVTAPPSARSSNSPPAGQQGSMASISVDRTKSANRAANSPVTKTDAPTPNLLNMMPESDDMMNILNTVNATNASTPSTAAPKFDFSSALDHYQNANGNTPLTPQQRDDMLAMMANQHNTSATNSALMSPTPPPMPNLDQIARTQKQLEILTNMQRQQDDKVQELNRRLQPLSPTGAIPGLVDGENGQYFADNTVGPGDFDLNSFINVDDDYLNAPPVDNDAFDFGLGNVPDGSNMDFNFGGSDNADGDMFQATDNNLTVPQQGHSQEQNGHRRVESTSSEATSLAPTVEGADNLGTPNKRQRRR